MSDEKFRLIIDTAYDAFITINSQGLITEWNRQAEKLFGWSRGEALGKTLPDTIIPPKYREAHKKGMERFLKTGEGPVLNKIIEISALHRGGGEFPVELTIQALKLEEGYVFNAFIRDITQRKQAEETLRKSEEKYRVLFDSIDEGFCVIEVLFDKNNKPVDYLFLEINQSFEEQTGIQNARGRRMREIAPEHEEHWFQIYGQIALTGESMRFENQAKQLHRWYDVYAFRIGEPQERKVAILFNNITHRKQAEENQAKLIKEIESANRELKDFAYVVSHDLKAPLRGIASLAGWLSEDYQDKLDNEGREHLELLIGRVKRMHNLIDGILQYSRVGRVKEERQLLDLNHLVSEVVAALDVPPSIQVQIEKNLPALKGEATQIEQVFQNLISNAVRFMDKPEGKIRIVFAEEGDFWIFSVSDNGPGIEARHFEKIFQIFQTLAARDQSESTGVGLAIVKKIVDSYGGRAWVESEVGKGSSFFFTLPKSEFCPEG